MIHSTFVLLVLLVTTQAFTVVPKVRTTHAPLKGVLTTAELEKIINRGNECEKGECSISDVDELVAELQEQQHNLHERILNVDKMIASLEVLNGADGRDTDEVRETVRAIFRLFSMGAKVSDRQLRSHVNPIGYPGEVGSGPTDAYKALNPKPWKP
eukprot:CAMPEP_0197247712 /NCGR_PEP_ID=MMETSP1429-20130617/31388_1 /TAXON_ID=49237 /ORGANISM="Chaetoceros  sp., Strain UNC1202" /LENGTH=155 /DNA_ID=CAMNT_0042708689 /DNA_START=46 /DNA_END=513 /DNA_ORIENTATION=+